MSQMSLRRLTANRLIMMPIGLLVLMGQIGFANEQRVIVAFGDSTTAKRGELNVYLDRIQTALAKTEPAVRTVNAGVGGNTTEHARKRFETDVLAVNPDLVIIQFGINDAAVDVWKNPPATKPRVSIDRFVDNLRYFVTQLKADGAEVIVMTPNPLRWTPKLKELYGKPPFDPSSENGFNLLLKKYAEQVRRLAAEERVRLVDVDMLFTEFAASDNHSVDELLLDGIHPNDKGHQLIADLLLKEVSAQQKTVKQREGGECKIRIHPESSLLTENASGTTHVRFEDYVSNPPPATQEPVEGWVKRFSVPFKGLTHPSSRNTSRTPLPTPVGLLIETNSDSVGFYDPSSRMTCSDLRGRRLLLRFVDTNRVSRAATVSRISFRVTGTAVLRQEVRMSLYSLDGKRLGSTMIPANTNGQPVSEVDCEVETTNSSRTAIHKVILENEGDGYFVLGGVNTPAEPDVAFSGYRVTEEPVQRPASEQIPRVHFKQWKQHEQSELLTDLTQCQPREALSDRRQHDKWKIFDYETAEYSGKCLSVGMESSAPDLTLDLNQSGWHAVYIGLSTITNLVAPSPNRIEVKFTSDRAYRRFSNQLDLATPRRDVLEEVFVGVTDLTENDLHLSTAYQQPARIHYVKTVPLTDDEVEEILAVRRHNSSRNMVATFDGFTWIHPFRPQSRADLAATFAGYAESDFGTWWFQVGGADLVHHPSEYGTLMGGHLDTFPRRVDREYVESVKHLHSQGINPLQVAVDEAHAQDTEILICLRAAGWKGAPPWEEFFMSEFYEAHPEWRCVDHDGTPTMHLSYAVEEVQNHLLKIYREALLTGADGAGFLFHRGMPMILWEEPFCRRFEKQYGINPRTLAENDPRVYELRAEIVTSFVRKIRKLLDDVAAERGVPHQRLKLAVSTFATEADNRKFGLDVEQWIDEKLIDQIGIAWFAHYTSGLRTKSGDTAYYSSLVAETDIKVFTFYVGWKLNSATQLIQGVLRDYDEGADGIAIWDPNQFVTWQDGKNPYWPLVSKLGQKKKLRAGELLFAPVTTPLTRLGTNHYSRWFPNTGF